MIQSGGLPRDIATKFAITVSVKAMDKGVQPIIGCQITLQDGATGPVVLLVQNQAGWLNLMALSSCLYLRDGGGLPHVTVDELCKHAEGLICLTGGPTGPLACLIAQGQRDKADALADRLGFDSLWVRDHLVFHPHGMEGTDRTFIEPFGFSATNALNFIPGHVILSFCAPIAVAEAWRPELVARREQPWARLTPQRRQRSGGEGHRRRSWLRGVHPRTRPTVAAAVGRTGRQGGA